MAQAFSSLAKGRGGICVNSAAKIFRLLAQLVQDPEVIEKRSETSHRNKHGGWVAFRNTFGKPIGQSPRIQTWLGKAVCHALAGRILGDVCFRLAANGVRDETMGMIAKVYASKRARQTAIHTYQIQGGRSVHIDERRAALRGHAQSDGDGDELIENYIGENIHEFAIATVYEGPNPVLADVGAPNAMTRNLRAKYLEPIGLAEANGKSGMGAKIAFGMFIAKQLEFLQSLGWNAGWSPQYVNGERTLDSQRTTSQSERGQKDSLDHRSLSEELYGRELFAG